MYWVLHIVGRDIRGRTNSTCVQLRLPYTFITFFEEICVRLLPSGSSFDVLGTLDYPRIPHVLKSVLLLGDCITFKM